MFDFQFTSKEDKSLNEKNLNNSKRNDDLADIRSEWFMNAVETINGKFGYSLIEIGERAGVSQTVMYACWNLNSPLHKFGRKPTEQTVFRISKKFEIPLPQYMIDREKKRETIFDLEKDRTPSQKKVQNADFMSKRFPKFLTVKEVAEVLCCSEQTVLRLIHNGSLKHKRIGKRAYRVTEQNLLDYIES